VLLNFGIDEFINPRLRAAGLTRRQARRDGSGQDRQDRRRERSRAARRQQFAVTPVIRSAGGDDDDR